MLKRNAPSRQSTRSSGPGRLMPVPPSSSSKSRISEFGDGPTIQTQTATTSDRTAAATTPRASLKRSNRTRTTTRTGGGTDRQALRVGPTAILNNGSSSSCRNGLTAVSPRESDPRGGDCWSSSGGGSRVPWLASPDVRARNIRDTRKTKYDDCRTRRRDEAVDLLGGVNSTGNGTEQKPFLAGRSVLQQHFTSDQFERKVGSRKDHSGDAGRSDCGVSGERPSGTARRRTRTTESRTSSNVCNLKREENEEQEEEHEDRQEERWGPDGSAEKDETSPRCKSGHEEEPIRDTVKRKTLTSRNPTAARENSSAPTKNAATLNGHSNGITKSMKPGGVTAADSAKHDVLGAGAVGAVNAGARRHPKKPPKPRLQLPSISMKPCTPAASTSCDPTSAATPGLSVPAPAPSNKPTEAGKSSFTAERNCSTDTVKEVSDGNLPACPYPGQENVSWTCLGCDGARHYLTSRNAMEPLQRVHGFKVTRVPNDGDCFYSSIMAALEGSPDLPAHMGAEGLSVAQMRAWVAEEAGEEQLAFYILQATANAEERWLDFVRPMSERLPSSEDEVDEDEDEDEGGDCSASSQSQQSPHRKRKAPTKNRRTAKKCRTRKCNQSEPDAEKENGGGCPNKLFPAGNGGRDKAAKSGKAPTVAAAADRSTTKVSSIKSAAVASATRGEEEKVDDRDTWRRTRGGASSVDDEEAFGWETSAKTSTKQETPCLDARRPSPSTDRREGQSLPAASRPDKGNEDSGKLSSSRRVGSRRSYRLGAVVRANEMAAGAAPGTGTVVAKADKASGGGETGMVVADEERREGKKAEDDVGLPFVQSVDEFRRFVRLEGSEVGHGRCMWADTFAHHVVSRRLRLTILFVDMEREKSAWPYRVLATGNAEDSDGYGEDERFVVLKREPNHFVLLTAVPPPSPPRPLPEPAGERNKDAGDDGGKTSVIIGKGGGRGKSVGVVDAPPAKTATLSKKGKSCFRRSELPDVVRKLWNIEPQATLARAVMNEKAGAEARGV